MKKPYLFFLIFLIVLLIIPGVIATNTSYQGVAYYATSSSGAQTPDLAFDNDLSTYWQSLTSSTPKYIEIDYGSGVTHIINQMNLSSLSASYGGKRWFVYGTNDNTTFYMVDDRVTYDAPAWSANEWRIYPFNHMENMTAGFRIYKIDFVTFYGTAMIENEISLQYSTEYVPIASFSASATSGSDPLTVTLIDTSTDHPLFFNWSIQGYGINTIHIVNWSTTPNTFISLPEGNFSITHGAGTSYGFNMTSQFINVSHAVAPNVTTTATTIPTPTTIGPEPTRQSFECNGNATPTSILWNITPYLPYQKVYIDGIDMTQYYPNSSVIVQSGLGSLEKHSLSVITNDTEYSTICQTTTSEESKQQGNIIAFLTSLNDWIYLIVILPLMFYGLKLRTGIYSTLILFIASGISLYALAKWLVSNPVTVSDIWHLQFFIYGFLFLLGFIIWVAKKR